MSCGLTHIFHLSIYRCSLDLGSTFIRYHIVRVVTQNGVVIDALDAFKPDLGTLMGRAI